MKIPKNNASPSFSLPRSQKFHRDTSTFPRIGVDRCSYLVLSKNKMESMYIYIHVSKEFGTRKFPLCRCFPPARRLQRNSPPLDSAPHSSFLPSFLSLSSSPLTRLKAFSNKYIYTHTHTHTHLSLSLPFSCVLEHRSNATLGTLQSGENALAPPIPPLSLHPSCPSLC